MAQQSIDLNSLSLEQLNQLKQQLEEELNILGNSFQQLKMAAQRYMESKESMAFITKENEGKKVYVPMTSSMLVPRAKDPLHEERAAAKDLYVQAELADAENVLIDIGTGYYVKKNVRDAKEFADRKVKLVNEQADKLQQAIAGKRRNMESVVMMMQQKLYAYDQAQKQATQ